MHKVAITGVYYKPPQHGATVRLLRYFWCMALMSMPKAERPATLLQQLHRVGTLKLLSYCSIIRPMLTQVLLILVLSSELPYTGAVSPSWSICSTTGRTLISRLTRMVQHFVPRSLKANQTLPRCFSKEEQISTKRVETSTIPSGRLLSLGTD